MLKRVFLVFLLLSVGVFAVYSFTRFTNVVRQTAPFHERLENSAVRMTEWFVRNQTEAGDFPYEQYAANGEPVEGYNIVRQAGSLYALAQAYRQGGDTRVRDTLLSGFSFFERHTATTSGTVSAVSYDGEVRSNTTALFVLALSEYLVADDVPESDRYAAALIRYADYLTSTQTEEGGYINVYGETPEESDYNNGETMYALMRAYETTGDRRYMDSVVRASSYAISRYGSEEFNTPFYSWGMAAFAYLYTYEPKEEYWAFMRDYTDRYMHARGVWYERQISDPKSPRVPPGAAVYLEGVTHAALVARKTDQEYAETLIRHVRTVLEELLRYEIGSPAGRYRSHNTKLSGAVCARETCETTRIDVTQHLMSASLLYLRFLDP